MSYSYSNTQRRQATSRGRGGNHHSVLGYWAPLVFTVTAATIGLAAWIWSEKQEHDDDDSPSGTGKPPPGHGPDVGPGQPSFAPGTEGPPGSYPLQPGVQSGGPPSGQYGPPSQQYPPGAGGPPQGQYGGSSQQGSSQDYYRTETSSQQVNEARDFSQQTTGTNESVIDRMTGAFRRTPSPQKIFDDASKKVAAGVAAAGAVVGGALQSIREEDRNDFADHERWSQEAETKARVERGNDGTISMRDTAHGSREGGRYQTPVKRKNVAIVISAETDFDQDDGQQASLLTQLPLYPDPAHSRIFILIYAPTLKRHPLSTSPSRSLTSSHSTLPDASTPIPTPGSEVLRDPMASPPSGANTPSFSPSSSPVFNNLYIQAQKLVEKDTQILPFTTPSGHVHLLRHLAPDIVYVQASLTGNEGDIVKHISGWVGEVVVVIGVDGGHGGLVDTEDEEGEGTEQKRDNWWVGSDLVGLGKGVQVVEGMRVGEDWGRRIEGQE